ncbi:MAG: type II toxin-antitoxin system HicB family antitoxin [Actinomycetota bacterium]|nr:type II toxin-antitoxin system HicB family antitoxin [Actinomycetota bacterium]
MDLTRYVERLRADLATVAESAGPEARATAERLVGALDSAVRMAMLEALSDATAEITTELPGGTVEVRLKGREPQFVVAAEQVQVETDPPDGDTGVGAGTDEPDDDGAVARVTVRIPESLKARVEELASSRGQSLNSWIVQALRYASRERAIDVDIDLSSLPFGAGVGFGPRRTRRVQGWVR